MPTPGLVLDALYAPLGRSEDPTVETIAHFWRGRPDDLAFARREPEAKPSLADPKLRIWRTEFTTVGGLRGFVATVGIDDADAAGPNAEVARAGPALRDALAQDLSSRGAVLSTSVEPGGAWG